MALSSTTAPASRLSAKSLAIDLLSTMPARFPVTVSALVMAAGVLGIGESSMRVALARLRARGLVESDARGLYRLSDAAKPVNREVRSWRSIEEGVGSWDGGWLAVDTSGLPADRKTARIRTRALRFLGFEQLSPAMQIRPDNLIGGVAVVRERLLALGFAPMPVAFRLDGLDDATDVRARALWNTTALEAGYATLREALEESAARLPGLTTPEAMAESFTLGGEAVRRLVLDPLLPEPIVDVDARRALVEQMRRYDRAGRDCWKAWAGESVELESAPADVGGLVAASNPA